MIKVKRGISNMDKNRNNVGSSVIEITMLIPIFIGCIYFYIIMLLFFVRQAEMAGQTVAQLYSFNNQGKSNNYAVSGQEAVYRTGNTDCIKVEVDEYGMKASLIYRKDGLDVVKSLRRWQFVADTIQ